MTMKIDVKDCSVVYKAIISTTVEAGSIKYKFNFKPIIDLEAV